MEGVALYSYRRLSAANKEDGRGVRAGNEIAKHFAGNNVDVIIYAVEKSLDSYKFNLLHCKQTFISQLKSGALGARTIDEGAMDEKSGMNFSSIAPSSMVRAPNAPDFNCEMNVCLQCSRLNL